MVEKNLRQRLLIIAAVLIVAAIALYPPKEKLRAGLDIAGGASLIYEIQEEAGDRGSIAEDMKTLLQKRVDPKGVYDLQWRVVGRNRIEVAMPLAPPENQRLRGEFLKAQEELYKARVTRGELESACRLAPEARAARLKELAAGSEQREKMLLDAATAYDAYRAATDMMEKARADPAATQIADTQPAEGATPEMKINLEELRKNLRPATEAWENAVAEIMDTNFEPARFQDVLELDPESQQRKSSLEALYNLYPNLKEKIAAAVEKHQEWRKNRMFLESPADLQRLLRGSGVMEFRILAEAESGNVTKYDVLRQQLKDIGPRPKDTDTEVWFPIDNPMAFFYKNSPAELKEIEDPAQPDYYKNMPTIVEKRGSDWFVLAKRGKDDGLLSPRNQGPNWKLRRVSQSRDEQGRPSVAFELDPIGGSYFRKMTGANTGKQMGIFVDDVAYSQARILTAIGTSGEITGEFSPEKINYLVRTMQAGSLPGRLKDTPVSERVVGSSLGETNLKLALRSGIIGIIAVYVLMIFYYRLNGLIASLAMTMNVVLTLAIMAMIGARFNLAGIAGIILGIGMAVDANVLIYERMREEKERGSSLRMIIKNGYDKAFTTIFDSHVTTLLSAVILYYVGSEEIKGFGLTLGWGIVLSLFTSVYVTRTAYTLLVKYGIMKDVHMMKSIGVPNIDWYSKRKMFLGISGAVLVVGISLLLMRDKRDLFDVEFTGGVNAEVQLRSQVASQFDDVKIRKLLDEAGRRIETDGRRLADATVQPGGEAGTFRVAAPGLKAPALAAMITEPLEEAKQLQRDGVRISPGDDTVVLRAQDNVTQESLQSEIRALGQLNSVPLMGGNIARANIGQVLQVQGADAGTYWSITTTAANKKLVQHALVSALGENLQTQPKVTYAFRGNDGVPYPIDTSQLAEVIPGLPAGVSADLTEFLGGAALYFDNLEPPQTIAALSERIRNMRLQPDFQDVPYRETQVFGVTPSGASVEGQPTYRSVVVAVVDPAYNLAAAPEAWTNEFAMKEKALVQSTLDQEQALRKVTTFKPQVAGQAQTRAILAMLLAWAMIIAYIWIRFGQLRYGIAGVIALVHDVLIALAFVGISGWIGGENNPIGRLLLIEDFKIDMTIIAALLTLIGYSINDKIVIFDRIREVRGRLGIVTAKTINDSLNQTLSRTLLTGVTVLIVLLIMYIFGGISIRGFNYCMFIGVITGTYSSIAIAAPLLLFGKKAEEYERAPAAGRLAPA